MDEKEIILKIYIKTNENLRFYISLISYIIILIYLIYVLFLNIKIFVFLIIIIAILYIIKNMIKKERPIDLFTDERNIFIDNYSFPSIHTVISILLILFFHNTFFYILLIVPILRIISLRHWISDIIYSIILSFPIYYIFYLI